MAMSFDSVTIGINSEVITKYLETIKADVIEVAKKDLTTKQEELFTVFKENWRGQSEENFEANMKNATVQVQNSLDTHYNVLVGKINAIHNAWIQQDEGMVQVAGGEE